MGTVNSFRDDGKGILIRGAPIGSKCATRVQRDIIWRLIQREIAPRAPRDDITSMRQRALWRMDAPCPRSLSRYTALHVLLISSRFDDPTPLCSSEFSDVASHRAWLRLRVSVIEQRFTIEDTWFRSLATFFSIGINLCHLNSLVDLVLLLGSTEGGLWVTRGRLVSLG